MQGGNPSSKPPITENPNRRSPFSSSSSLTAKYFSCKESTQHENMRQLEEGLEHKLTSSSVRTKLVGFSSLSPPVESVEA